MEYVWSFLGNKMGIKNKRKYKGKWIKLKNGYYARWSKKDGDMIVFKKGKPVDLEHGEPYVPKEKLK